MESSQHIPTSVRFLHPKGFPVGPLLFPSPPRAGTQRPAGKRGWHGPRTALGAPLVARCYLVSRDSRYSSAMS